MSTVIFRIKPECVCVFEMDFDEIHWYKSIFAFLFRSTFVCLGRVLSWIFIPTTHTHTVGMQFASLHTFICGMRWTEEPFLIVLLHVFYSIFKFTIALWLCDTKSQADDRISVGFRRISLTSAIAAPCTFETRSAENNKTQEPVWLFICRETFFCSHQHLTAFSFISFLFIGILLDSGFFPALSLFVSPARRVLQCVVSHRQHKARYLPPSKSQSNEIFISIY